MTSELAQARARRAGLMSGIAAIAIGVAAVTAGVDIRSRDAEAAIGPVLPGFAASADEAVKITVQTKDGRYEIRKTPKGWALADRGDFPVRQDRLAQLTKGLEGLVFVRPMTRDLDKHERIGLGDPTKGGSGVLVQIDDAQGAHLAELIFGGMPGRGLFVRKPDEAQTWAVRGELPPMRDPAQWLDLAPYHLQPERVARVEVYPPQGDPYILRRESPDDEFVFAPPNSRKPVASRFALESAAIALASLEPIDVRNAAAIQGNARARIYAHTFDGLLIDAAMYAEGGRHWIKLIARAQTPEREPEVAQINRRAAPWAFGLSTQDYEKTAPAIWVLTGAGAPVAKPTAAEAAPGAALAPPPAQKAAPKLPPAEPENE